MDPKQREFLTMAGVLPARLNCQQTAWRLNCAEHDVPILAAAGILRPLGKPGPTAPKFYALADVEEIAANPKLLDKATAVIQAHWRTKREAAGSKRNGSARLKRNGTASHQNGNGEAAMPGKDWES